MRKFIEVHHIVETPSSALKHYMKADSEDGDREYEVRRSLISIDGIVDITELSDGEKTNGVNCMITYQTYRDNKPEVILLSVTDRYVYIRNQIIENEVF